VQAAGAAATSAAPSAAPSGTGSAATSPPTTVEDWANVELQVGPKGEVVAARVIDFSGGTRVGWEEALDDIVKKAALRPLSPPPGGVGMTLHLRLTKRHDAKGTTRERP
jgi:hypothetical protein